MTFTVPGRPKALARKRVFRHGSRMVFAPAKGDGAFRDRVAFFAKEAGVQFLTGPVEMRVDFYFDRPMRLCRKGSDPERKWNPSRPDADNLLKGTCDALNGVAWRDDAQVVNVWVGKWYHEIGGVPRTEIVILEIAGCGREMKIRPRAFQTET